MSITTSTRDGSPHEGMDPVLVEMRQFGKDAGNTDITVNFPVIHRLLELDSQRSVFIAGAMCLELSSRRFTPENLRISLLHRAEEIWGYGTEKWRDEETVLPPTLRSAIGVACIPSQASIILDRTLPGSDKVKRMHQQLCDIGKTAILAYEFCCSSGNGMGANRIKGVVSELAVLLLHQRSTMETPGGDSKLALLSHVTEDNDIIEREPTDKSPCWDMSVFAECPHDTPSVIRKVQIKSRYRNGDHEYDDDIVTICIDRDLSIDDAEEVCGQESIAIVQERCLEYFQKADTSIINRLDSREERLTSLVG